ncbi:hypothetical protein CIT292_09011 [Citrobacter youngae ATCC 29220]|uniref:Uncharacterized protein n=1 Tax=Citrobacter youngae ATCC 29220 TaxID=500640 RepID=D4BFJ4_9ENTR|nr:hypothetical protein CIT292_09011 [Citrobacter youngae ATCC 29220]
MNAFPLLLYRYNSIVLGMCGKFDVFDFFSVSQGVIIIEFD